MASKTRIRSYVPHLAPFWKATAYYFLLYFTDSDCESGWYHAVIKLLPMMALITFTVLHGASLHGKDIYGSSYSRLIICGLTFASIGDILLVWKEPYFILGILAFSLAHIMYTIAFGFETAHWIAGFCLGIFAICFWLYVSQYLKGVMVKAVLVYACIISTMLWRAIARIDQMSDLNDSWTKICSCVGAILFTISDISIALSVFVGKLIWSNQIIMSTYYLAQFGIAFSVVDCQNKQRGMNLKRLMKKSTMVFRRNNRRHHHHHEDHDLDGSSEENDVNDAEDAAPFYSTAVPTRSRSDSLLGEKLQPPRIGSSSFTGQIIVTEARSEMMENGASDPPRSQSPTDQLIIKNKKIKDVSFADGMSVSQDSLTTTTKDFSIRTLKSNIDSSTTICTTYSKKKVPDTFSKDK